MARAFADDIGGMCSNLDKVTNEITPFFINFGKASGLNINAKKIILVPAKAQDQQRAQQHLTEKGFGDIKVELEALYLGIFMGPNADRASVYSRPWEKFKKVFPNWKSTKKKPPPILDFLSRTHILPRSSHTWESSYCLPTILCPII